MNYIKIIILIIFGLSIPLGYAQEYFNTKGNKYAKVENKSKVPKFIVDTITVVGGRAQIDLNKTFAKNKHDVSAKEKNSIFLNITQVMSDTTVTLYDYGYYRDSNSKIIIVSSGGASDTSLVTFMAFIR